MQDCQLDFGAYKAVIFDLDGTLVDSSAAIAEVMGHWCASHNLDPERVMNESRGGRLQDFLPKLAPHLDAGREFEYLCAQEAVTTTGVAAIPGARTVLGHLDGRGLQWGIATSGINQVARMRLRTAGLPLPEILVTAEMVARGKPDPEHFVTAAGALRQQPRDCLAFEDSENGVRSALAAGCEVVVVGEHTALEHPRIRARIPDYRPLLRQLGIADAPAGEVER